MVHRALLEMRAIHSSKHTISPIARCGTRLTFTMGSILHILVNQKDPLRGRGGWDWPARWPLIKWHHGIIPSPKEVPPTQSLRRPTVFSQPLSGRCRFHAQSNHEHQPLSGRKGGRAPRPNRGANWLWQLDFKAGSRGGEGAEGHPPLINS